MADSNFWRDLAREFRALPEDDTYAEKVIDGIPGTIPPPNNRWMLHSSSVHIAMEFELLARRGGDELSPNDVVDSFEVWINALHSYNLNVETRNLSLQVRRRISNLSETSALFCGTQAIRVFEEERVRKAAEAQQNDPRNWSALRQHYEATQAIKGVLNAQPIELTAEFVAEAVARHEGMRPEDVTNERIMSEITAMLPHYPSIRLVPAKPPASASVESAAPVVVTKPPGSVAEERKNLLDAYKRECKERGITVTDEMIAKAASSSWNDRTQVTWWKREAPKSTPAADKLIRAVLIKKPHLQ
jgi:hypothetical protein